MHIFSYSVKKNTLAASFKNTVSSIEKKRRVHEITKLQKEISNNIYKSYINKEVEVIFENNMKNGYQSGYSSEFVPVFIKTDKKIQPNIYKVVIIEYKNEKLLGKII